MPGEMTGVTREDRNREYAHRHDSQRNGWCETMKPEEETRHARQYGRDQKPFGPAIESFAGEQSEQNNQASKDSDETDQCMNDCVCAKNHGLPITSTSTHNVTSGLRNSQTDPLFCRHRLAVADRTNLAKAGSLERSCPDEILGLGRKGASFDHTRDSHSGRYDRITHNRAARANA